MRRMTVEEFAQQAAELMGNAEREGVVLTKGGRAVAVLLGLEVYDAEDLGYMTDPSFWRMIRERRKEPTVRLADVKAELLGDDEGAPVEVVKEVVKAELAGGEVAGREAGGRPVATGLEPMNEKSKAS